MQNGLRKMPPPQVIVTVYEIVYHTETFGGASDNWATWARVARELNQVLLVGYAALNPIAYCGGPLIPFVNTAVMKMTQCCRGESISTKSELEMMKSVGITLNGADPMEQQLRELDAQSRILTGIHVVVA